MGNICGMKRTVVSSKNHPKGQIISKIIDVRTKETSDEGKWIVEG